MGFQHMERKSPATIAIARIVLGTLGMLAWLLPRAAALDPSLDLTRRGRLAKV